MNEGLQDTLPSYMIPTSYVSMDRVPITPTGKTSRRQLQEIGDSMEWLELLALNRDSEHAQRLLRRLRYGCKNYLRKR